MAIDYVGIKNTLLNLIDKNNTTTSSYDISSGLQNRVTQVSKGRPNQQPIPINQYPVVFVDLQRNTQEIGQLGNSATRHHEMTFVISPVTHVVAGKASINGQDEIERLTQNVESLIRNHIQLSCTSYGLYVDEMSTEYDIQVGDETTWNEVSNISIVCRALSS